MKKLEIGLKFRTHQEIGWGRIQEIGGIRHIGSFEYVSTVDTDFGMSVLFECRKMVTYTVENLWCRCSDQCAAIVPPHNIDIGESGDPLPVMSQFQSVGQVESVYPHIGLTIGKHRKGAPDGESIGILWFEVNVISDVLKVGCQFKGPGFSWIQ